MTMSTASTRDQLPDNVAAKQVAREAARRVATSQGYRTLLAGAILLAFAMIMAVEDRGKVTVGVGLVLSGVAIFAPLYVRRARGKAGLLVSAVGENFGTNTLLWIVAIVLGLVGGAAYAFGAVALSSSSTDWLVLAPIAWGITTVLIVRLVRLRLWEDALVGVVFPVAGVFFATDEFVLSLGAMGAALVIAGWSMHARWRRWARTVARATGPVSATATSS